MKTKGIPIKGGVVKDFVKDYRALKLKTKGIPVKGRVNCSLVGVHVIQKECIMEMWKIDLMEFSPR